MNTCLISGVNLALKYILYTSIVQFLEFQAIFTRDTKDTLIRQLRDTGKVEFGKGKPIACTQSEGEYKIYTIRTVDHFTRKDIDSFRIDNNVMIARLRHLKDEKLLMFT